MNELIKKLKATPANIIGDEAEQLYDRIYNQRQDSIVYHSSVHGFDKTAGFIDWFIKTRAKIGPSDGEFMYSYQPFLIGQFQVSDDDGDKVVSIWFMLWTNCIVAYYECGQYNDISIVIKQQDAEEMLDGRTQPQSQS